MWSIFSDGIKSMHTFGLVNLFIVGEPASGSFVWGSPAQCFLTITPAFGGGFQFTGPWGWRRANPLLGYGLASVQGFSGPIFRDFMGLVPLGSGQHRHLRIPHWGHPLEARV